MNDTWLTFIGRTMWRKYYYFVWFRLVDNLCSNTLKSTVPSDWAKILEIDYYRFRLLTLWMRIFGWTRFTATFRLRHVLLYVGWNDDFSGVNRCELFHSMFIYQLNSHIVLCSPYSMRTERTEGCWVEVLSGILMRLSIF